MGLKAGWLALFIFVWIIGAILGSTFDGYSAESTWVGTGEGGYTEAPRSTLEVIATAFDAVQRNPVVGGISMITNPEVWKAGYKIVTWQWTFVQDMPMFYWVFLFPFVAMGVLSVLLLAYGVLTGNIEL